MVLSSYCNASGCSTAYYLVQNLGRQRTVKFLGIEFVVKGGVDSQGIFCCMKIILRHHCDIAEGIDGAAESLCVP